MRIEHYKGNEEDKIDFLMDQGFNYIEYNSNYSEMIEYIDIMLKEFNLELVIIDDFENIFYKIMPISILDAIKFHLEGENNVTKRTVFDNKISI